MDLDWENRRISLSHRQTLQDPWDLAPDKFPVGKTLVGTVKKLMNFGAFVELEPGIEGLIHISNMGMGRRINHPREAVHEGEEVEVNILTMDQQARRIGLELSLAASLSTESISRMLQKGDIVSGTVDSVKDYGVFVALPDGRVGLLHVSEIDEGRRGDLKKRFPVGSSVEVEVLDIDPGSSKISLSARTLSKKNEDAQFKDFVSGRGTGASFGTLGDLLKNKLKG
jgi:small subunit ribosomal protein S1